MAKVDEPDEEGARLSDREREAFREVFDLLIPADFNILSFNKKRIIKSLMKLVEEDIAITRLKLRRIREILEKCYEHEQTHEGDLPPNGTA